MRTWICILLLGLAACEAPADEEGPGQPPQAPETSRGSDSSANGASTAGTAKVAAGDADGCAEVALYRTSHHVPAEPGTMLAVRFDGLLRLGHLQSQRSERKDGSFLLTFRFNWAESHVLELDRLEVSERSETWRVCAATHTDAGNHVGRVLPDVSHLYIRDGRLAFNLAVQWIDFPHVTERWMGAIDL